MQQNLFPSKQRNVNKTKTGLFTWSNQQHFYSINFSDKNYSVTLILNLYDVERVATLSKPVWHKETKNSFAADSVIPILEICLKKIIQNVGRSIHCSILHSISSQWDMMHHISKYSNVKWKKAGSKTVFYREDK